MSDRPRRISRTPTRATLPKGDPRHGLGGYQEHGCRCEVCKAAQREAGARYRAAARAAGLPPGDPRHGRPVGYKTYGCKCEVCTAARDAYRASQLATDLPEGDPRHGVNGYRIYGCRCAVCVAGASAHQADERSSKRRVALTGPDDERHGTITGYDWHRCRCARCREAWRADRADRLARLVADPQDPRHGTQAGRVYGCRCVRCAPPDTGSTAPRGTVSVCRVCGAEWCAVGRGSRVRVLCSPGCRRVDAAMRKKAKRADE